MENMMKDFVPYQQSLELIEIGFNEPCLATIDQTEYIHIKGTKYPIRGAMCYMEIPCPTFAQAFRFFREKYDVHMYPKKFDEKKWWIEWGSWRSPLFNSFEKAELACLIRLIEILKNL